MYGNLDSVIQEFLSVQSGILNPGIYFSCGIRDQGLWNQEFTLRNPESREQVTVLSSIIICEFLDDFSNVSNV